MASRRRRALAGLARRYSVSCQLFHSASDITTTSSASRRVMIVTSASSTTRSNTALRSLRASEKLMARMIVTRTVYGTSLPDSGGNEKPRARRGFPCNINRGDGPLLQFVPQEIVGQRMHRGGLRIVGAGAVAAFGVLVEPHVLVAHRFHLRGHLARLHGADAVVAGRRVEQQDRKSVV